MIRFKLPENPENRDRIQVLLSWLAALLLAGFLFMMTCISFDVNRTSTIAMKKFGGDRVTALTRLIEAPEITLNVKNDAVWALGQLGDERALPTLERYYHGGECNHDSTLCQYELKKALTKCRGGFNPTALTWRWAVQPKDSLTHRND